MVLTLEPVDFYKSMTTPCGHVHRNVGHDPGITGHVGPEYPTGDVYLKLTVIDDVLIVSFKEL